MNIKHLPLVLLIVLVPLVSAVDCGTSTYSFTYNFDEIPVSQDLTGANCNNPENSSVSLTTDFPFGDENFFILDSDSQTIEANSDISTITIDLEQSLEEGNYIGIIKSNSESLINVNLKIEGQPVDPNTCQINPSLVSYTQQIQQGTKVPLPKITFNPLNCDGTFVLTSSAVSIQGGVVTPEGQKPVFISSVESDGINIEIDTEGLNSQTYNSKLKVSAFGKLFEIPFTIIVTGGTSSPGDFNINNLPSCSLTQNVVNINETHSLVCSNLVPDVTILPQVDAEYIRGIGLETESNQFVWNFQGKKFGNSKIMAEFYYLGVPVGDPFSQEVKIQSTSGQTPGTSLILSFTPDLNKAQNGEEVLIQVLDNKTNSLVVEPELYIDSTLVQNKTGASFRYAFQANTNYSVRAVAPGYNDLVSSISLSSTPITVNISPESGNTNTIFTINTDVNATIFINGENHGKEYVGKLKGGDNLIEAFKEGFLDKTVNFSVENVIIFTTSGEFKKGVLQTIGLSKNTSWDVYFQKDVDEQRELLLSGEGSTVEFEPTKKGDYIIETEDGSQRRYTIEGFNWNQSWWFMPWYIWILIGIGGIYLYFNFSSQPTSSNKVDVGFAGRANY